MMRQKNLIFISKTNSLHKRKAHFSSEIRYYGPPRMPQPYIEPSVGYLIKKKPFALKKAKREVAFEQGLREESNAFISFKVGETNLLKRFDKLKYLQAWKSKKTMYNLCEESQISKLQQSLLASKCSKSSPNHRKYYSNITY